MGYYVVKVYGLTCDADGCEVSSEFVPHVNTGYKLLDVRRQAAQPPDGWTYHEGRDFCPEHSAVRSDTP